MFHTLLQDGEQIKVWQTKETALQVIKGLQWKKFPREALGPELKWYIEGRVRARLKTGDEVSLYSGELCQLSHLPIGHSTLWAAWPPTTLHLHLGNTA